MEHMEQEYKTSRGHRFALEIVYYVQTYGTRASFVMYTGLFLFWCVHYFWVGPSQTVTGAEWLRYVSWFIASVGMLISGFFVYRDYLDNWHWEHHTGPYANIEQTYIDEWHRKNGTGPYADTEKE